MAFEAALLGSAIREPSQVRSHAANADWGAI